MKEDATIGNCDGGQCRLTVGYTIQDSGAQKGPLWGSSEAQNALLTELMSGLGFQRVVTGFGR